MSTVTELREAYEEAARKVDADARLLAQNLITQRRIGSWPITAPDLDSCVLHHERLVEQRDAARDAWDDAAAHNVSRNWG